VIAAICWRGEGRATIYYHQKTFSSRVSGSRIVSVNCGQCGTDYHYELVRTGVGTGSAPYGLGARSAQERADKAAAAALEKALAMDAEMVPCPGCGWVNDDLIRRHRRHHHRWTAGAIIVSLVLCLIGWIAVGVLHSSSRSTPGLTTLVAALAVITVGVPVTIFIVGRALRGRIDPNRRSMPLPPGTPPALVARQDDHTGHIELVVAPVRPEHDRRMVDGGAVRDTAGDRGRLVIPEGKLVIPPYCCYCLEPASSLASGPAFLTFSKDLVLPACDACARIHRAQWWVSFGRAALVGATGGLFVFFIPGLDPPVQIGLYSFALLASVFIATFVAHAMRRPYRIGFACRSRNILWFEAKEPRFHELVVAVSGWPSATDGSERNAQER